MAVLRHRNFRLLFMGQAASTLGDGLVFVALALYVTDIGSPSDVGLVLGAATLPLVAFLLIGGVWADRLPRHRVMIVTDLVRFGLHAVLAGLIFSGVVEVWHIVVIEALFGTAEAFFRPAHSGLVPQTVPESMIQEARAASSTLDTIAEFAGPALATVLVLGAGAGWAFAIDALTFLVSAALLAFVRPRERGEAPERRLRVTELRDGWVEVRTRAWCGRRSSPSPSRCCCPSARGRARADRGRGRVGSTGVFACSPRAGRPDDARRAARLSRATAPNAAHRLCLVPALATCRRAFAHGAPFSRSCRCSWAPASA